MHPVLFELTTPWGERPVYSFGLFLGLAVLLGWYTLRRAGREHALDEVMLENAYAATVLAALLGGRIGYVFSNPRAFPTFLSALSPSRGGLLASSAILFGLVAALVVARRSGARPLRLADAAAPALAVALVLVRVGCYLYGCDYGTRLSANAPRWLVALGTFPREMDANDVGLVVGSPAYLDQMTHASSGLALDAAHALPVHPTQLYEALLGVVVLGVALAVALRGKKLERPLEDGDVFLPSALVYGLGRLAIEPLRGDLERGFVGAVSAPTLVSLAIVATTIAIVVARRVSAQRRPNAPA